MALINAYETNILAVDKSYYNFATVTVANVTVMKRWTVKRKYED